MHSNRLLLVIATGAVVAVTLGVVAGIWLQTSDSPVTANVAYAEEGEHVGLLPPGAALDAAETKLGEEVYLPASLPDARLKLVSVAADTGPAGFDSPVMHQAGLIYAVGTAEDLGPLHIAVGEFFGGGLQPGPDSALRQNEMPFLGGTLFYYIQTDNAMKAPTDHYMLQTPDSSDLPDLSIFVVGTERPSFDAMLKVIESFAPRSQVK